MIWYYFQDPRSDSVDGKIPLVLIIKSYMYCQHTECSYMSSYLVHILGNLPAVFCVLVTELVHSSSKVVEV